jgi:uncharacterized membrane protein
MFGVPLHPLVVHFPIVLAILLPLSALVALWAIRRGTVARRAWLVPLALSAALTAGSFAATQTGDLEEDRVERVVGDRAIHEHEEAGERLLVLSGVLLLVVAAGLLPNTIGRAARMLGTAGAVGLIVAAVQVGHSGGLLVYRDGAASAYADTSAVARAALRPESDADDDH